MCFIEEIKLNVVDDNLVVTLQGNKEVWSFQGASGCYFDSRLFLGSLSIFPELFSSLFRKSSSFSFC